MCFSRLLATVFYSILVALCGTTILAADKWSPKAVVAEALVEHTGGMIIVPARVDGKCARFILDTGSTHTLIDEALVRGATPTDKVLFRSMGASTTADVYKSPRLQIAGIDCRWISEVPAINMNGIRRQLEENVDGIIGMNFLCRYQVHIDFDNGRLLFCEGDSLDVPPGSKLPMLRDLTSSPVVELNFVGLRSPERFAVDTGLYDFGRCTQSLARRLCDAHAAREIEGIIVSGPAGGTAHELAGVRCNPFFIGSYKHSEHGFYITSGNLLGLHWLVKYRATFDFPHNYLYLSPSDKWSLTDRSQGVGFLFESGYVIGEVEQGSLAERAGMQIGDVIIAINDRKMGEWSRLELMNLFSFPSRDDIVVTVQRGTTMLTARIPGE